MAQIARLRSLSRLLAALGAPPPAAADAAAAAAAPAVRRGGAAPAAPRSFGAAAQPAPAPPPPPAASAPGWLADAESGGADAAPGADLTPRQVVELLDRHIVGQAAAKKAVANALRNRWRRHRVPSPLREEIVPKNILMIGPTGCGKTEIARRLARIADAPFVKVEATKFTEVGFHGRDVDQIVRDLVENAITMVRARLRREQRAAIDAAVEARLVDALVGPHAGDDTKASFRELYRAGALDDRVVEVDVPPGGGTGRGGASNGGAFEGASIQEMVIRVDRLFARGRGGEPPRQKLRVAEARPLVEEQVAEALIPAEAVTREAVAAAEQDGIVFIDEIDKIVTSAEHRYGADASSEGVQRDLLPIIEGSQVSTKHGPVNTDHVLFICSGAFHSCKPSDMLAELQGRLPVRVELKGLTADDFYRILTEPAHNMVRQQQALLGAEGLALHFTDAALREVARVAEEVNASVDNIGARRLHTVLERVVEDISFEAPERARAAAAGGAGGGAGGGGGGGAPGGAAAPGAGPPAGAVVVDKEDVAARLGDLAKKQDLSRFVL